MNEVNQRNAQALYDALKTERARIDVLNTEIQGLRGALELLRGEVASLRQLVYVQRAGTGPSVRSET